MKTALYRTVREIVIEASVDREIGALVVQGNESEPKGIGGRMGSEADIHFSSYHAKGSSQMAADNAVVSTDVLTVDAPLGQEPVQESPAP